MRDAAAAQRSAPLTITTGLRLDKEFYPDGSPRPPRTPRHLPAADVDRYGANRPGFRTSDAVTADRGQAVKDAAYAEMCLDLQDAWKSPEQRIADARQVTADAACPAGVDPRDFAYHQRCLQDSEAWRTPPTVFVATPPAGAYCQAGVGANEGDIVTWNGAPARLVKRGNWLFPVVHQQGATRSGTSSGDAVPRTMDAATAQKIKDAAYNEMVSDLTNAWKA
jgi:hypothetical protein